MQALHTLAIVTLATSSLAAAEGPSAVSSLPVDAYSHAEPDQVRIREIGLDLVVDFERRELRGHADLHLDWLDPGHGRLALDTRDLHIEAVHGRSGDAPWQPLEFELAEADEVLGSRLSITTPAAVERVRVRYRTAPGATALQWLEPSMTAGGRHPFLFSQSQSIHARSWVPLQDTPSVRFTYRARIAAPAGLTALMSAAIESSDETEGVHRFHMPEPIPAYLLALAVGELEFRPIGARTGVWAEPGLVEAAAEEFADTERMVVEAEALYGPYRWGRYDLLVLPPSFPFGGMENPRLSFITPTLMVGDRSLSGLIAHELAHSWSGNLVTNARWEDAWLNEGFTTYVEHRILEAVYGPERAAMEAVIRRTGFLAELENLPPERQRLALPSLPGQDPDDFFTAVAYAKGAWFLKFLEARFGRERFDAVLRGWFDTHAFESVTTDDFVAYLRALPAGDTERVSAAELQEWLYESGVPDSAPPIESERFQAVDALRARWLDGRIAADEIPTQAWSTHEWLHFLEGLPATLSGERLAELDEAFAFTGTPNGEFAQRWYPLAERSGYAEARPAMAEFLARVGRRKLILPIYEALAQTDEGRAFARRVFEQARPGYHPLTVSSVEAALAGE
jgi:leukotriene-A4 hydrolase